MSQKKQATSFRSALFRRCGLLAGFVIIGAFLAAFVVPATAPPTSVAAPPTASAKVGNSAVYNVYGETVRVYCDYGSSSYYTLKADPYNSKGSQRVCTKQYDTDQTMSPNHKRCVKFVGPKVKDGWYWARPGKRYKVPDLSSFAWHEYGGSKNKCGGKPEYPLT